MGTRAVREPSLSSPLCRAALGVYRPRRPRESPLYRLVEDHFETLERVHEAEFQPRYGWLRRASRNAVLKFLDCSILERGFARVRCDDCRAEFLVAFSCKARILCPSCNAKRPAIGEVADGEGIVTGPGRKGSILRRQQSRMAAAQPAKRREGDDDPWNELGLQGGTPDGPRRPIRHRGRATPAAENP